MNRPSIFTLFNSKAFVYLLAVITIAPVFINAVFGPGPSLFEKYYTTDDSFYYFKIAENIWNGTGSSFDGLTITNSYQPIWLLICTPIMSLKKIDPFLPLRIMLIINAIFYCLGLINILSLLRYLKINETACKVTLILMSLAPFLINLVLEGTEAGVNWFFITLYFRLFVRFYDNEMLMGLKLKEIILFGVVAGLLFLARLDNVFVIFFTSGYLIYICKGKTKKINLLLSVSIIPFIYILFNQIIFGHRVPVSGKIKEFWHTSGGSLFGSLGERTIHDVFAFISRSDHKLYEIIKSIKYAGAGNLSFADILYMCFAAIKGAVIFFIIFLFFKIIINDKKRIFKIPLFLLLIVSSVTQAGYYFIKTNCIENRNWYWLSEWILFYMILSFVIDKGLTFFHNNKLKTSTLIVALLVFPAFWYVRNMVDKFTYNKNAGAESFERIRFLDENVPENDIVGTPNAGEIGYFSKRKITNIDGLVNSYDYLDALKKDSGYAYLKRYGVTMIFLPPYYLEYQPYKSMFSGKLTYYKTWVNGEGMRQHDLFKMN